MPAGYIVTPRNAFILVMVYIKTLTQKCPSKCVTVSALTTRHKTAICQPSVRFSAILN